MLDQRSLSIRAQTEATPRPQVLVVDDDASSRRLLSAVLESAGFLARPADSGENALSSIQKDLPDLVLLDLEMPGMTGAEVCTRLRHDPRAEVREIPVIMLTAHDSETEEVRCLEAGANDFVTKPVGRAALAARLQTQLRLRAMGSELRFKNEELERWRAAQIADLEAARITQQALIPTSGPATQGWQIESLFTPLIQVGGDVYGWRALPGGRSIVWLADATGHGASAALFTTLTALLFHHAGMNADGPSDILREVNKEFHSVFRGRSFMTACCALLEPEGLLRFSSAGHPPMLTRHRSGNIETFLASGTMIGITPHLQAEDTELMLEPGDVALLFTDGLYSLKRSDGERMTWRSVESALQSSVLNGHTIEPVVERLREISNGEAFDDDLTALAIRRKG